MDTKVTTSWMEAAACKRRNNGGLSAHALAPVANRKTSSERLAVQ